MTAPTRSEVGAHALLNGWTAFYYLTSFEQQDGWCLWHEKHHAFRTANAHVIVRASALPEGAKEVIMGEVPESFFWALVNRVLYLGLLPALYGYRNPDKGDGNDDRRDGPGHDTGALGSFRL